MRALQGCCGAKPSWNSWNGSLNGRNATAVLWPSPWPIDHFKKVNDRHGHLAGDTLLRQVSQVIAGELRSTDWIGRYGGEEFVLILPETDILRAGPVAEKIRDRVHRTVVPVEDGAVVRVTVSIGLASLEEVAADSVSVTARDLIAAADRSLYYAKNGGRNRVHPLPAVLEELASQAG